MIFLQNRYIFGITLICFKEFASMKICEKYRQEITGQLIKIATDYDACDLSYPHFRDPQQYAIWDKQVFSIFK